MMLVVPASILQMRSLVPSTGYRNTPHLFAA